MRESRKPKRTSQSSSSSASSCSKQARSGGITTESTSCTYGHQDYTYVSEARLPLIEEVKEFLLSDVVDAPVGERMMICYGGPGTGKTSTMEMILNDLDTSFKVIRLLGSNVSTIWDLLQPLLALPAKRVGRLRATTQQQLKGEYYQSAGPSRKHPKNIAKSIKKVVGTKPNDDLLDSFNRLSDMTKKGEKLIIFIDELDLIFNGERKKNNMKLLLNHLLQVSLPNAKMLGCLNNYDFVVETFMGAKVECRTTKFEAYNFDQALLILRHKYPYLSADSEDLEFAVRKIVARRSGDLRYILDFVDRYWLCREANPPSPVIDISPVSSTSSQKSQRGPAKKLDRDSRKKHQSTDADDAFNVDLSDRIGHSTTLVQKPNPIVNVQQLLGQEYASDVNRLVTLIETLPSLQQLICATLFVVVDRTRSHTGISANLAYQTYRELCEENKIQDAISKGIFDNHLISLSTQDVVKIKAGNNAQTPLQSSRKPMVTRTPLSRQRIPACQGSGSSLSFDFQLDYRRAVAAFEKLHKLKVYGFSMYRMTAITEQSD